MTRDRSRDVTGRIMSPGDVIAWFRGGRYDDIAVGIVRSFTDAGRPRMEVLWDQRADMTPGSTHTVDRLRTVVLEYSHDVDGNLTTGAQFLADRMRDRSARRGRRE